MRKIVFIYSLIILVVSLNAAGQSVPEKFKNPVLPGFNPDPSICRVGDDYYLATSSFTWYPGMPVYHSKDLVNWRLIGHGLSRPGLINMKGLNDNDGIWAVTIRHHNGIFYLITTANKSGGNFYVTATDPSGPWSDPVWLKDAPGIDPSLFWDDDGKCYYTGNTWDFKKSWPSQCAVWMQELDLNKKQLVGQRKILAYGHANNATYAEGPHIYKVNGKYVLIMAEGGASYYHAVTAHQSDSLWGPYTAGKVNPVLSHRHLGRDYPIQNIGHADLVQTPAGDWYSVVLGIRNIRGLNPLARETFLSKVVFEQGMPVFNPGYGILLAEQTRPDLPWTPVPAAPDRDEFNKRELDIKWYKVKIPVKNMYSTSQGQLRLPLQPEVVDSAVNAAMVVQRTRHHRFTATTRMKFKARNDNEQAGLIFYRTANGYYSLMKDLTGISLIKKHLGKTILVEHKAYAANEVILKVVVIDHEVTFSFGKDENNMLVIGGAQSTDAIADNAMNKFNGPGIGVYATSNGKPSKNMASYDWFEYKSE